MVIACTDDSVLTEYLSDKAVREALHIPPSVQDWEACSEEVYSNYGRVYKDLSPQYMELLKKKVRASVSATGGCPTIVLLCYLPYLSIYRFAPTSSTAMSIWPATPSETSGLSTTSEFL